MISQIQIAIPLVLVMIIQIVKILESTGSVFSNLEHFKNFLNTYFFGKCHNGATLCMKLPSFVKIKVIFNFQK